MTGLSAALGACSGVLGSYSGIVEEGAASFSGVLGLLFSLLSSGRWRILSLRVDIIVAGAGARSGNDFLYPTTRFLILSSGVPKPFQNRFSVLFVF